MEPRQLLAATVYPIQVGAVYFEDHDVEDSTPDVVHVTFTGGAPGTQLKQLTIDTDKMGDGLTIGDVFFDTSRQSGQPGAFSFAPLTIVSQSGIDSVQFTLSQDRTKLTFTFEGFDAGESLVFSVDVDEMGFLGANAVAEGNEFEGSKLSATFTAPHYYEASGSDIFLDFYDQKLASTGLNLPPDSYVPPAADPQPIYTAGAIFPVQQTPLPISIAGTVFEDFNFNNVREPRDVGLAGVRLSLLRLEGGQYVATGLTTTTNAQGDYRFDNLAPGTYRIVETQPSGYVSVGARAGTVDGSTRGSVDGADAIRDIVLDGGEDSIKNDFAEARYAKLSGHVYHDANNNGVMDAGEQGIAGATVRVQYLPATGSLPAPVTAITQADGSWMADNLLPGNYRVDEVQPTDYLDGLDAPGTAGGAAHNPGDLIDGISLVSGQVGTQYDFGEILPAGICGYVIVDKNGNNLKDAGEPPIAGVTLRLLDASGNVISTTQTDDTGHYCFRGLYPGVYGVQELQPAGYFDGADLVGVAGGQLLPPDSIVAIALVSGTRATDYNFLELEPVSLSGFVYVDDNNNGSRDAGEAPIAGVTLVLLDAAGNPTATTTTTDSSGYYRLTGLTPNAVYGVAETQPAGYYDGLDTAGNLGGTAHNPGDSITGVRIPAGQAAQQYNFGELRPASISGKVYVDENQNSMFDAGETLLSGVTVYLLDASGNRSSSTVTDAAGHYEFNNLRPGVWGVEEIQPAGYFDGADQVGSAGGRLDGTDRILGAKLTSGSQGVNYDFGELRPASISGYVFQDGPAIVVPAGQAQSDLYKLRDGLLTPDDMRLSGVTLKLADKNGAAILDVQGQPITTVTDANGYYEFKDLKPGYYTVIEVQPDGYLRGINTPGSSGGLAMGPNSNLDQALLDELELDPHSDAILRIPLRAGDAAVSNNFSEILVQIEVPSTPVVVVPPETPAFPPLPVPSIVPGLPQAPSLVALPGATGNAPPPEPLGGGGGVDPVAYSWHLSVINAGLPRRDQDGPDALAQLRSTVYFNPVSWTGTDISRALWILADADGRPIREHRFGLTDAEPVAGDWNGDGTTKMGVFLNGLWFLDLNGNGTWDNGDLWAQLGQLGDQPVTGDWDGDGKTDVGILGPVWAGDSRALAAEPGLPDVRNVRFGGYKNVPPDPEQAPLGVRTMKRSAQGKIRADLIDHVFRFGHEGDIPVTGDWNGDGIGNIGLFRGGTWYLDDDGDGKWSEADIYVQSFGQPGDTPVVGDWTGDGISKIGVYRGGTWILDINNNRVLDPDDKVIRLGGPGDIPVVGDWTGDGVDKVGIYRPNAPKADQQAADAPADKPAADAPATTPATPPATAAKPAAQPVRK